MLLSGRDMEFWPQAEMRYPNKTKINLQESKEYIQSVLLHLLACYHYHFTIVLRSPKNGYQKATNSRARAYID